MFNDERYEEWNDDEYDRTDFDIDSFWGDEGWDDLDEEEEPMTRGEIEEILYDLIDRIHNARKVYDMSPVDRVVLDILEELIDIL
jgi:hypothetical protein